MKAIFTLTLLSSTIAVAGNFPANNIACKGEKVTVTFSPKFTGQPQLTIEEAGPQEAQVFEGRSLIVETNNLGQVVSGVGTYIPDRGTTQQSLVLPRQVNLTATEPRASFNSVLLTVEKRTSIGGPSMIVGAVTEVTQSVPLSCEASSIMTAH